MAVAEVSKKHPCFNKEAKGSYGRVHLPVAPKCNIMCNYCNRKYDCVNESRPGVSSGVLSPQQALEYMDAVLVKEPRISVVGIAGPGDPMANADKTIETIRLIHEKYPSMLFCLSSNGMALEPHLEELAANGVTHVTVTCNAVDPELGKKFYRFVRDGKVSMTGTKGATRLLERQLGAIKKAKELGMIVKVNTIVVPGLNDDHIETLAKTMADLGADMLNLMPLCPVEDTPFADREELSKDELEKLRAVAEKYMPQMRHCKRCRADAVGLLDEDKSKEFAGCLQACASGSKTKAEFDTSKPHVAVATMEGMLVNRHLGEADTFEIWTQQDDGSFAMIERRPAPQPGKGSDRWAELASVLSDCRAVLVSGYGDKPAKALGAQGIHPVEMEGFIEQGLDAIYTKEDLSSLRARRKNICDGSGTAGCSGGGEGC